MQIALAQIQSIPGKIADNLLKHYHFVKKAADQGADFVLFPELSVTAYEPKLAAAFATTKDDPLFEDLQRQSDSLGIIIGVGMPIKSEKGIYIGLIIFSPNDQRQVYRKQILHEDELSYFIAGKDTFLLDKGAYRIALAICYESLLPEHAEQAAAAGATHYVASVAKSSKSIEKVYAHFPTIASKHRMPALVVNGIGPMDDFKGAGRSAAWDQSGNLIGRLEEEEDLLSVHLEAMII